jgi:cytochrome c oxidase cbb3-type subunit III
VVIAMLSAGQLGRAQKSAPSGARARISGRELFTTRCAGCHGLDARGGERGPNIAANPNLLRMPDEQLRLVISNGIPNHGMPAFRLIGQSQIKAIVAFVRSLQGSATLAW